MCDKNTGCKTHNCDTNFQSIEDLEIYQKCLEHELSIVKKAIQDIRENK